MPERDGYIPGVPCWVDTTQPDPDAAAEFYGGLFGWEFKDAMPPGSDGKYLMASLRGGNVAAVSSPPQGSPPSGVWNTYVWVESADDTAGKVNGASGSVVVEPFDVMDAGRMAVFTDPEGAAFRVWQANEHKGAQIVNEHGTLNFNVLNTRDPEAAKRFYGSVFGWTTYTGTGEFFTLPGYGDYLERLTPGIRKMTADYGVAGFEEVVAAIQPLGDEGPAHWSVTFATDDADATAARARELGGEIVMPPVDVPWARITVITDPQGGTFTASKFVPENRDLAADSGAAQTA
jgi:uncharacterized protein